MGLFGSTNLGVWHGSLRIVCAIFGLCTLRTIDNAAISSLARSYYVGFEFSPIGIVSVVARSCLSGVVVLRFWFDTLCFFLANTGFHQPWLHILTPFSLPNRITGICPGSFEHWIHAIHQIVFLCRLCVCIVRFGAHGITHVGFGFCHTWIDNIPSESFFSWRIRNDDGPSPLGFIHAYANIRLSQLCISLVWVISG